MRCTFTKAAAQTKSPRHRGWSPCTGNCISPAARLTGTLAIWGDQPFWDMGRKDVGSEAESVEAFSGVQETLLKDDHSKNVAGHTYPRKKTLSAAPSENEDDSLDGHGTAADTTTVELRQAQKAAFYVLLWSLRLKLSYRHYEGVGQALRHIRITSTMCPLGLTDSFGYSAINT
ncbi:hypothetical protein BaRGS_00008568 [Batillaria attramentaria]|uniref:Uncharacterized protein n=1 Tax=Batillaria attramentaria TaxID=370345 RepID=A0ABD0LKF0_9CAEN